jgi:poly-gamma-glutamate capsule biosynthesis protein CapA/YwtB (metallophosphatase superfamily)
MNSTLTKTTSKSLLFANLTLATGFALFAVIAIFGWGVKSNGTALSFEPKAIEIPDTIRISIGAIGDIMAHETQLIAQKTDSGTYDFKNNYAKVSHLFKRLDLMVANFETTLSGEEKRFTGYPMFNAPDALAEAVYNAGIHLVSLANNHIYDRAESGFFRTIEVLEKNSITPVGVRKDKTQLKYVIKNVGGINIGITAFTYESGKIGGKKTINGLLINERIAPLVNSFDPSEIRKEAVEMERIVKEMKADSVDLKVFLIHWGDEYRTTPNKYQVELANLLNQFGVDLILGSHPHVVQPFGFIENELSRHRTFIAYSLGNFISNQRFETNGNYHTEDGLLVQIDLVKPPGEKTKIEAIHHFPLWVNRDRQNNKNFFEVLNCWDFMEVKTQEGEPSYSLTILDRIRNSYKRTKRIIEENSSQFSNSDGFMGLLKKHPERY